jgi:hypothetical protein
LKFGDIIIAMASLAVVVLFISVLTGLVIVSAIGWDWGPMVGGIVSYFLSGLIVGAIFSKKIWEEAGMRAIAKIVVLGATILMLFYAAAVPTQGDWTALVKETYLNANPGATLTTSQWWTVEVTALGEVIASNVFIGAVSSFVGLYVGSMLRKPKKG